MLLIFPESNLTTNPKRIAVSQCQYAAATKCTNVRQSVEQSEALSSLLPSAVALSIQSGTERRCMITQDAHTKNNNNGLKNNWRVSESRGHNKLIVNLSFPNLCHKVSAFFLDSICVYYRINGSIPVTWNKQADAHRHLIKVRKKKQLHQTMKAKYTWILVWLTSLHLDRSSLHLCPGVRSSVIKPQCRPLHCFIPQSPEVFFFLDSMQVANRLHLHSTPAEGDRDGWVHYERHLGGERKKKSRRYQECIRERNPHNRLCRIDENMMVFVVVL